MALFNIPKIPKLPIPSPAKYIIKANLELQKVALKAQKYAACIGPPVIGTALKPISKAFAIKNNALSGFANLTQQQMQAILTTVQSTIASQAQNIQNATSLNIVDEEGNVSTETVENIQQDLEQLQQQAEQLLENLDQFENLAEEQIEQIKQLVDDIKNFDIKNISCKKLTIKIPSMPKLPFGIIQPF